MSETSISERNAIDDLAAQGAIVERLTSDSRRCAPRVAFLAYPGESADGRLHIGDAIGRGAAGVLWESDGYAWRAEWRVPNVGIHGLRARAGLVAHVYYGRPSESLWVCGITGTNGKTSCSQWLAALLSQRGVKTGVVGTLGSGYPGSLDPLVNTTPGAVELHGLLAGFRDEGAHAVAMEVSSHALMQERVSAVAFDCAVFTNLSHDHLDYHGSMQAYGQAKARLFDAPGLGAAVLNLDDAMGAQLAQSLRARGERVIGYGLSSMSVPSIESIRARIVAEGPGGTTMELESTWGTARTRVNQFGRFNVSNALAVLGALVAHGVPFAEAAQMLDGLPPVPGRMQRFGGGGLPLVVVDYAHTPDALEKVLGALRPVSRETGGALVVVFGAGGDRDPLKRPVMGAIARQHADRIMLTSDNPRSEDPRAIIEAIRAGAGVEALVQTDRARAIADTIMAAESRDVILVAGKGHETYQDIAGTRHPFSDAAVVRAALARRGAQ